MPIINGKMTCDYCGAVQTKVMFCIGASRPDDPQWTMVEGTGKITCPGCYPRAMADGQRAVENYVNAWNTQARKTIKRNSSTIS